MPVLIHIWSLFYRLPTSTKKDTRTAAMRLRLATVEKAVAAEPGGALGCIREQE